MTVKEMAAIEAQDAASHGYNGRDGAGAQLLKKCARAVRFAARKVQRIYGVPYVGADERCEYTGELVARLVGENDGMIPAADTLAMVYLVKRATGLILNDRARYGLDITEPGQGEARSDARLTGPLTIPPEIEAAADRLDLTQTARRAFFAAAVPATREEWADFYGYANPAAWHRTAKRGRIELRMIGEDALRQALRAAELEASSIMDEIEHDLAALLEAMQHVN